VGRIILGRRDLGLDAAQGSADACQESGRASIAGRWAGWPGLSYLICRFGNASYLSAALVAVERDRRVATRGPGHP